MTLRHNHADRRLELSLAARDAEIAKRRALRALLKCSHYPVCDSLAIHAALAQEEADAKAARLKVSLAHPSPGTLAEKLMRFRIEKVEDGAVRHTTASEMYAVFEAAHFVAIRDDTAACTSLHPSGDTSGCADAIRAVLAHKLADSLNAAT